MFQQILIGLSGVVVGIAMVAYARKIIQFTGTSATAERYLGGGGSYTALRLLGLFIILVFFLYMIGYLDNILLGIWNRIFS